MGCFIREYNKLIQRFFFIIKFSYNILINTCIKKAGGSVYSVIFSPDSKYIIAGTNSK
jgi:hypothetical protein